MGAGAAVGAIPEIARRPSQNDSTEALHGHDVHPLLEVHLGAVDIVQLAYHPLQNGIDRALVPLHVGREVGRANEPSLEPVPLYVPFG